jgi:hypothetical protein
MTFAEDDRNWILRNYDSLKPNSAEVAERFYKERGGMVSYATVNRFWREEDFPMRGRGKMRVLADEDRRLVIELRDSGSRSYNETKLAFIRETRKSVSCSTIVRALKESR